MTRTRSIAATFLLALAGLLLMPSAASAANTGDVARALLSNPVYVDAQATSRVDEGRLRSEISSARRPIYVAVLPAAAASANGGPSQLTVAIGRQLGADAILFTVSGTTLAGGAGGSSGLSSGAAGRIAAANAGGDTTEALVKSIQQAASSAASGSSGAGGGGSSGGGSSGGGGGGAVVGVLAVLGLGGGGLLYARSRRSRQRANEGARADVESLYNRLGADVSNLSPGDDPVTRQALADASERYTATGALLAQSDTPGEFEAARRTVVEGLTAARLVRTRIGVDPGPEIPPPPGSGGPQLLAEQRVQVGDQEYDGSPSYSPGRQHYFGGGNLGGRMVPGGWYGVPFWETMLLGSVLSGGFGGGFGGGGGYERGYEEGVDSARDAGGGGGSDWGGGGGGGGDWGGGGGGDWGGGGGGGDGGGGSW